MVLLIRTSVLSLVIFLSNWAKVNMIFLESLAEGVVNPRLKIRPGIIILLIP
ncbi:hypothetical protein ACFLTD_03280 [Elusimicrobiota bacterium]